MAEQKKTGRRTFFAGLGLATAAGVAASLNSKKLAVEALSPAESTDSDKYRLSEHVKKYYRTTTI
jgi:hypothetical protein